MTFRCGCHVNVMWTGTATAHCSHCGLTFSGVTGFDEHLTTLGCRSLRAMKRRGYVEVRAGVLGRPTPAHTPNDRHPG